MEELQARHRKEQRDLQSRITQKKKHATKKTRKGVNDECDSLEAELKLKQADELAGVYGSATRGEPPSEQLDKLTLKVDGEADAPTNNATQQATSDSKATDVNAVTSDEVIVPSQVRKPNRQKERLARRKAEQEQAARQAAEEAKNLPDKKQQERERMLECMKERGLREKEIRADGHCLYSAVADQLEQIGVPLGSEADEMPTVAYKTTREAAASYIEQHQDDFVPFLEEPLPEYLHKVRDTGEWGGQLELTALAKSFGVTINVLQDFGRVETIEPEARADGKNIWLGYYKHGFGLGEHYNSLRRAP